MQPLQLQAILNLKRVQDLESTRKALCAVSNMHGSSRFSVRDSQQMGFVTGLIPEIPYSEQ